jgi:hypothetical protein
MCAMSNDQVWIISIVISLNTYNFFALGTFKFLCIRELFITVMKYLR